MAQLSVWVMNLVTLPMYNKLVAGISVLLLILFLTWITGLLRRSDENRWIEFTYLFAVLLMIILHFRIMFEMNIEIIHIFQYSILALLIFPLHGRYGAAVFFTIPFMLIDEWNQYINLYPAWVEYFEFNDVILDINGCGLAMIVLLICGVKNNEPVKPLWKRGEVVWLFIFIVAVVIALKTCFISLYDTERCSNTWLALNKIHEPVTFWRKFPTRDVYYHVMQPLEAIISIVVLSLFYIALDMFVERRKG